ncbi:MAG TPA: hypothetical protein VN668_08345 [Stellaceae bacterium]|nr:hypothetical protein [Stellaceae bacterium]
MSTAFARLNEVAATIAAARRSIAEGALVELSGLDAAVAEICEAAPALPAAERNAFAQGLAELAAALDELAGDLVRQREAALRHRANDAYGQEGSR